MDEDRFDSEQRISEGLATVGRESMTHEQIKAFVSVYGIPWWVEPTEELIVLCPIRLRPAGK